MREPFSIVVSGIFAVAICAGQDASSTQCCGGRVCQDGTTFANVLKDGPWPEKPLEFQRQDDFASTIRPLLVKYCGECHAPGQMEELDFLAEMTEVDIAGHRSLFAGVVEQMDSRAMPPRDSAQPTEAERSLVVSWIRKSLDLKPSDIERIAPYVVNVFEDRQGHLWFGTMSKGAARFDGQKLEWFSRQDGLPSNEAIGFAEDKEGNLWFGSHGGLSRYDGKSITNLWSTSGRHDQGEGWMAVRSDRAGNIWTSTYHGVFRHDGASFSEFRLPIDKKEITSYSITPGKALLALEDSDGNLWFQTDGYGALKFDGQSFTRFTSKDGLCSNNVTTIIEDKQGNIWFACMQSYQPAMTGDGGVCRYDGKTFTRFPEVKGLSENDIYTIYETGAGDIWIGATGVGAYCYDGEKFTLFDKTDRPHWTRNFGLQAMLEDRNGTLWCGFSGGLFRFDGKSFTNVTGDGLRSVKASQVQQEQDVERILEAPDDWGAEQIPFPLSFAPSISFNGYEDIRFSPDWSKPDRPGFWTYKMVWQIDEDPQLTEERLADLIETYFDGLSRAVTQGSDGDPDTIQRPVAVFIQDGVEFRGRLRIHDAFTTKDWICLNAKVRKTERGDKHLVAIEMSPKPFDHEVWTELAKIRVKEQEKGRSGN